MSLTVDTRVAAPRGGRHVDSLGIVLVASASTAFAETVGALVVECGFTPAFPTGMEVPWLSVTRTQPRVVICDWDDRVRRLRRMILEVSARSVPLIMAYTAGRRGSPLALTHVRRVSWQLFPVCADELRGILADLLPPDSDRGLPHHDEPSDAERQYRLDNASSLDSAGRLRAPPFAPTRARDT